MGAGLHEVSISSSLLARFSAYTDAEERRLRDALGTAKYNIDGMDTLALIVGQRGLERVGLYSGKQDI